jgi:hypothetical protein
MASDIIVRDLKREEYKLWDNLVEHSPHGTIFHESNWLSTCEELLNKKLKIYGCFENNKLVGGCSLYIHKKLFFKMASSIIEMTPYGGVILSQSPSSKVREQEQRYNNIIESLIKSVSAERFDNIRLVNSPDVVDVRPFVWRDWNSKIFYTYYLNLDNNSISKDARWTMNRALKNNIIVEKAEDISVFYELFKETFLRQGLKPPASYRFFNEIYNMLQRQNRGEMWIARTKSGEAAASEIIVYDNKRAYRWSAASHTDLRKTGAPTLLLCEIFQDLKKRGFKEINLMAANTPQLTKFITSFNPKLVPYYSLEKKTFLVDVLADASKVYKKTKWKKYENT